MIDKINYNELDSASAGEIGTFFPKYSNYSLSVTFANTRKHWPNSHNRQES